jgi:hypothetical protein
MVEVAPDPSPDSVEITDCHGEWFVLVVRNGKASISSFESEFYARSFAEVQRTGLGLPPRKKSQ